MGRRSINTTKSGKYMNPTDQARKEARKRELKKNKKQRMMVRAAVLKGKDPAALIMEMDKMDNLEYNVDSQPTLSEKVLKEKRKKLRETLDRVLKLYEKENPEYWVEIRRMEAEYEKKRQTRIEYYEAVRHAQAVTVDEIPLPNLDKPNLDMEDIPIPIPNSHMIPVHSILKKPAPLDFKSPPGCPPILPVELSDSEDEAEKDEEEERPKTIRFADDEDEIGTSEDKDTRLTVKKSKNLTSLQTKLLQMSGQDIDDFMKETETLLKQAEEASTEKEEEEKAPIPPGVEFVPPPPMILRPPPPRMLPPRMPPPPQGILPRMPNVRLPPPMSMRPMRPGMPPPLGMRGPPPGANPNVLTAGPQLISRPKLDDKKNSATIEAKPQIRNLSADVTRFLPTALRIKRDDKKKGSKLQETKDFSKPEESDRKPTKDDAYSQFMREMEDLL